MRHSIAKKRSRRSPSGRLKIIVEKHADGYVAYPLGLKGVVGGEGDTYDGAMADVKSAIRFHTTAFGKKAGVAAHAQGGVCIRALLSTCSKLRKNTGRRAGIQGDNLAAATPSPPSPARFASTRAVT